MRKGAIVCIDDERSVLLSLRDQLGWIVEGDYAVELAENGEEAIALLEELAEDEIPVPLVICDQMMPEIRGVDLLEKIHGWYPNTLKILLTGIADLDEIVRAVNCANLYRYIPKPWDQADLELTVREALRSYERDNLLEEQNAMLQREIGERCQAETLLRESEAKLESILNSLEDVIWSASVDTQELSYLNPAAERVYGRDRQMFLDDPSLWKEGVIYPDDRPKRQQFFQRLLAAGSLSAEYRILRPDGEVRWLSDRARVIKNDEGEACRIDGIIYDITERRRAEDKLAHDALHDALTGLPNRTLLMQRVEVLRQRTQDNPNYHFAVLFIDLDRFKLVNDSLGHANGDRFLIAISEQLRQCTRASDTVARLGGDEFTILLDGINDIKDAIQIAERVLTRLAKPLRLDDRHLFTGASIGIVVSAPSYKSGTDMLRDADIAMYRAKASGKGCYAIFDQNMHAETLKLIQVENDLRIAIQQQQLLLHYQPIVDLQTEELAGFEALVRWQHPEQGLINPDEFIPIAEDTGLIVPLGEWVLREACRQISEWNLYRPEDNPLLISVNLAVHQLKEPNLIKMIEQILTETGLNSHCLKLELTESMLVENVESIIKTLTYLRGRHIQFSIDDFGTGYSSLSYLHRFPVSTLKIDRAFISLMEKDSENFEIVRAICTLAHSLGMKVVAEGIERPGQIEKLKSLGCELGQGFYFSRPINAEKALQMLAETHSINIPRGANDMPMGNRQIVASDEDVVPQEAPEQDPPQGIFLQPTT